MEKLNRIVCSLALLTALTGCGGGGDDGGDGDGDGGGDGGGVAGTLAISNAPSFVGASFAPNPSLTSASAIGGGAAAFVFAQPEKGSLSFTINLASGDVAEFVFGIFDPTSTGVVAWKCGAATTDTSPCRGLSVDRQAGRVTVVNMIVPVAFGATQAITLNGTLPFTPF